MNNNPNKKYQDQGTITPTLFIGLGGTGSKMVNRIAHRAKNLPVWESKLQALTHFIAIDTNDKDLNGLDEIAGGNRIHIGAFDKGAVINNYRRAKDPHVLQWIDERYTPREGIKPGAGQIRIESRLGFYYASQNIHSRLNNLVQEMLKANNPWRQNKPPKFKVYIFCTLAGGTGSGSFLSIAYLIDEIICKQGWQPNITSNLLLSTLLTDNNMVAPELHPNIHANTYAALKEVEHLNKLDYQEIKEHHQRSKEPFAYYRLDSSEALLTVSGRPFFISFIFDKPPHLSLPKPHNVIADAAFLQIFTPIFAQMAGEFDNYETNTSKLAVIGSEQQDLSVGYSKYFGTFGAVTLVLPGENLLEYCALKFTAEAIRSQITFGIDQQKITQDSSRVQLLAQYAVDYSDPKFQGKDPEARERIINQSFLHSVNALARQDEQDEDLDAFWYQLVESIVKGTVTGFDATSGESNRTEAQLTKIQRLLEENCDKAYNNATKDIRARNILMIPKESVGQYSEWVTILERELRFAKSQVDELSLIVAAEAKEGRVVNDLKLSPLHERFLVIHLLELCANEWIPQLETKLKKHQQNSVLHNNSVLENLRDVASLNIAARKRMGGDNLYRTLLEAADEKYNTALSQSREALKLEIKLAQYREFYQYLKTRSNIYLRLSVEMNNVVNEIEAEAEAYLLGNKTKTIPYALQVEIFQTIEKPQIKLWDKVYNELFLDNGQHMVTFDRQALAKTISLQLQPTVDRSGKTTAKETSQIVLDIKEALYILGKEKMLPKILGNEDEVGLDIAEGLTMEARYLGNKTIEQIEIYQKIKLESVNQLAGVIARIRGDYASLNDGTAVNQRRLIVTGMDMEMGTNKGFTESLVDILKVNENDVLTWTDPRLIIIHDVHMPIPAYHISAITDSLEKGYLLKVKDTKRGYPLHTDYRWEEALPNLNPEKQALTDSWAIQQLVTGLLTKIIYYDESQKTFIWNHKGNERTLKPYLYGVLYDLNELYQDDDTRSAIETGIINASQDLDENTLKLRRTYLFNLYEQEILNKKLNPELSSEEKLDLPIQRYLKKVMTIVSLPVATKTAASGYADMP